MYRITINIHISPEPAERQAAAEALPEDAPGFPVRRSYLSLSLSHSLFLSLSLSSSLCLFLSLSDDEPTAVEAPQHPLWVAADSFI